MLASGPAPLHTSSVRKIPIVGLPLFFLNCRGGFRWEYEKPGIYLLATSGTPRAEPTDRWSCPGAARLLSVVAASALAKPAFEYISFRDTGSTFYVKGPLRFPPPASPRTSNEEKEDSFAWR